MPKQQERKFGTMPEWAQTGPIGPQNYHFRAEQHCQQQASKREGTHPTISRDGEHFAVWQEYFERHLGKRPKPFEMLLAGAMREMTVPEPVPQWFDPSFEPHPGWKSTWPAHPTIEPSKRWIYNVLVHHGAPQYAAMLAKAQTYPQPCRFWRMDPKGRGIFVPHGWLDETSGPTRARRFTAADLRNLPDAPAA